MKKPIKLDFRTTEENEEALLQLMKEENRTKSGMLHHIFDTDERIQRVKKRNEELKSGLRNEVSSEVGKLIVLDLTDKIQEVEDYFTFTDNTVADKIVEYWGYERSVKYKGHLYLIADFKFNKNGKHEILFTDLK